MTEIEVLLDVATKYCELTGRSEARVATVIFNHGRKFDLLRQGRDLGTKTNRRAMSWFVENWPSAAEMPASLCKWISDNWPADIDRPTPTPVHSRKDEVA